MRPGLAKLIRSDGTIEAVVPKNGKDFSLEELRTFVAGCIEIIHPPSDEGAILVVNEEGRLQGLPLNKVASAVYRNDFIVGDALLCHTSQVRSILPR